MENWEDKGGALPQHNVGLLYENELAGREESLWRLSVGVGLAPSLRAHELEDIAPFTGTYRGAGTTASARLEWVPHSVDEDSLGLILSRSRLNVEGGTAPGPLSHMDIGLAGAFLAMHEGRFRGLATLYLIDLQGHNATAARVDERHLAGYLQIDYESSEHLTLFARQEESSTRRSDYFSNFPLAAARRSLIGARFQLGQWNALSLELSRRSPFAGKTFGEVRAQWSAAIP
jgi:hypothetical protein